MRAQSVFFLWQFFCLASNFGQAVDDDFFDFDNFDAYLTTEKFDYSTLDPLSFFSPVGSETETPTEAPSEDSTTLTKNLVGPGKTVTDSITTVANATGASKNDRDKDSRRKPVPESEHIPTTLTPNAPGEESEVLMKHPAVTSTEKPKEEFKLTSSVRPEIASEESTDEPLDLAEKPGENKSKKDLESEDITSTILPNFGISEKGVNKEERTEKIIEIDNKVSGAIATEKLDVSTINSPEKKSGESIDKTIESQEAAENAKTENCVNDEVTIAPNFNHSAEVTTTANTAVITEKLPTTDSGTIPDDSTPNFQQTNETPISDKIPDNDTTETAFFHQEENKNFATTPINTATEENTERNAEIPIDTTYQPQPTVLAETVVEAKRSSGGQDDSLAETELTPEMLDTTVTNESIETATNTITTVKSSDITTPVPYMATATPLIYSATLSAEATANENHPFEMATSRTTGNAVRIEKQPEIQFNPRLKIPIDEEIGPMELTTKPNRAEEIVKSEVETTTKRSKENIGTISSSTFNPKFKIPIEDPVEPIELTTNTNREDEDMVKSIGELMTKQSKEVPSVTPFPIFNPKFKIQIDDAVEPFELTTMPIENYAIVFPTFAPLEEPEDPKRVVIPAPRPTKVSPRVPSARPFPIFNPKFKIQIDDAVVEPKRVNIAAPTRPTEVSFRQRPQGTFVFKWVPNLRKPIEQTTEPARRTFFKVRDPSCNCIRPMSSIPGRPPPVITERDRESLDYDKDTFPENIETSGEERSDDKTTTTKNSKEISVDDIGDILDAIPIPKDIQKLFPNLYATPRSELEIPERAQPSLPRFHYPKNVHIIHGNGVNVGSSSAQNSVGVPYKHDYGSGHPSTVFKVVPPQGPGQVYYKYIPAAVERRIGVPGFAGTQYNEQTSFKIQRPSSGTSEIGRGSNYFVRPKQPILGDCYYKIKDGPLSMEGDGTYGRLIIDSNTFKRCFHCCRQSDFEQCYQTHLSKCGIELNQTQPIHPLQPRTPVRPSQLSQPLPSRYQPQPLRPPYRPPQQARPRQPDSPCKVIKTWPNGIQDLPKFKVVCT